MGGADRGGNCCQRRRWGGRARAGGRGVGGGRRSRCRLSSRIPSPPLPSPPLPAPVLPTAQRGKAQQILEKCSSVGQRALLSCQTPKRTALPNANLLARAPWLAAAASPARLLGVPPTPRRAEMGPRAEGTGRSGHPSPPPTWGRPSAVPGRAAAAPPG